MWSMTWVGCVNYDNRVFLRRKFNYKNDRAKNRIETQHNKIQATYETGPGRKSDKDTVLVRPLQKLQK